MAKWLTKKMEDNNLTIKQFNHLRVALVHDFLTQFGGAERVLSVLSEMFPQAPIYTLLYDKDKLGERFKNRKIHTSFLQKFPKFLRKRPKYLLPFLPTAPETFDLREFDLVISSSGAWSKGIVTRLNTIHISYMHSPMRFVWDVNEVYLKQQKKGGMTKFFTRALLNYIRVWDKVAADRPDHIIANSQYTQRRIKKYYGRESVVIYPPVELKSQITNPKSQIQNSKDTKYFVVVSRLSPYKNIDVVVNAFNKLNLPLIVVGTGSQKKYFKSIAKDNVRILGWKSDEELVEIYKHARAFIFPCVDDFGMAPVEAMSFGVPVIALREGGITESMIEGKTGEFFTESTTKSIIEGVKKFLEQENGYDREFIKNRAREFGKEKFGEEVRRFINGIIG